MNTPKKILVAEDDAVLRNVLVEKLSSSGYDAAGAEDGEAAIAELRANPPDLLLLDMLMPGKSGVEVLEEMRKDPKLLDLPVIVISNSGQPIEIEQTKKLGAKDFLIKATFDPSEVMQKVGKLLSA